jgi:DNA-binding response OmpR family regulator
MNRILVIEDELGISELIGETLQRTGYGVDAAFNGKQGIQRFDDAVFDLVVTDMGLPDMDGKAVIRHIRNSNRSFTPIIGISGTPWLLHGTACDAILSKPFPLRALIDLVNRLTQFRLTGPSPERVLPFSDQPFC